MTLADAELSTTAEGLMSKGLRALFTVSVTNTFFHETKEGEQEVGKAIQEIFRELETRLGVRVLGTIDDDLLQVGASEHEPVSYILTEIPDFAAAVEVVNLVRTRFRGSKLARYIRVRAHVGRPLFFGNE